MLNVDRQDQLTDSRFVWFTGVIEDIADPMEMGRVRVRCFGYHPFDRAEVPTSSLPWAVVMTPITSASMSRVGQSATGVLPGSWVVGFFRDGVSAQDPLVLGTIPSISTRNSSDLGFSDPAGVHPLQDNEVDTPKQATKQFEQTNSFVSRKDTRQLKVESAIPPKLETTSVPEADSYYTRPTWNTPDPSAGVKPVYPNNHVTATLGGHVTEQDDSPGYRRTLRQHSAGTYEEVLNDGTRVTTIVGDDYTVVLKGSNVYIKGSASITIDGDLRQLVKGNYHLEVRGNKTELIGGAAQIKTGASYQAEVGQEFAMNVKDNLKLRVGRNSEIIMEGSLTHTINGDHDLAVTGDDFHSVSGDRVESTQGELFVNVSGDINIATSAKLFIESALNTQFITLGNRADIVGGNCSLSVTGDYSIATGGKYSAYTVGGYGIVTSQNFSLFAAGNYIETSAGQEIFTGAVDLTTGALSLKAASYNITAASTGSINAGAALSIKATGAITATTSGAALIKGTRVTLRGIKSFSV
jgi:hypothetical protein